MGERSHVTANSDGTGGAGARTGSQTGSQTGSMADPLGWSRAYAPNEGQNGLAAILKDVPRKRLTILGATGSIGCSTLDLVREARKAGGPDRFPIEALTAQSRVDDLIAQAREFRPALAVIGDESHYAALKAGLEGTGIEAAAGVSALCEAAARPSDWLMAAIVGAAGLAPTLEAVKRGAEVALANKECLVCAGDLVRAEVLASGAVLLPVDSEHNAIYQVLDPRHLGALERIILTASGGPFREWPRDRMAAASPAEAVAHPNWSMGAKISVDSATMMNKGLEFIEAAYLFPVPPERIEILIHPQSVIHSMVAYTDGSVLAQLGSPDMRTPIAHTLAWPARMPAPSARLDLAAIGTLTFEAPDAERFPAIRLTRDALMAGGGAPTVLNAANEVAVARFLEGRLGFLEIAGVVEASLDRMSGARLGAGGRNLASLDDVHALDGEARAVAGELAAQRAL